MTTTDTTTATTAWAAFDKTTSRWGRLTMIAAMIIMIGGPGIIAAQLGVKPLSILAGVLAIAAVFGAVWFVEPLSYFPILGAASMYQAFMIGNISNKLLPAAIVAQATIEAKPETKRGQLAAVLAICGAAAMHLTTLAILVGIFGTLIIRAIPAATITSVQTFVLPAVIGAVLVQMVVSNPKFRILTIASSSPWSSSWSWCRCSRSSPTSRSRSRLWRRFCWRSSSPRPPRTPLRPPTRSSSRRPTTPRQIPLTPDPDLPKPKGMS